MDIEILPRKLSGNICVPPSKSHLHRLLICAAFADRPTRICGRSECADVLATVSCLRALGASIEPVTDGYLVTPVTTVPECAELTCGDSGSTLRMLLPVVGALGIRACFTIGGSLSARPLTPLTAAMEQNGCRVTKRESTVECTGKLRPGTYSVRADISSQFISGLLLACAIMDGQSHVFREGIVCSEPYIEMTLRVMHDFGITTDGYTVFGVKHFASHGEYTAEADRSCAAFFIGANAIGSTVTVKNLTSLSLQPDSKICDYISQLEAGAEADLSAAPDLFPVLSVVCACTGGVLCGIERLRFKESDRVDAVCRLLRALGGEYVLTRDRIQILPCAFHGATVDSCRDHRIAMAAAIAATVSDGSVILTDAECVSKSYPQFWADYQKLGGHYEQYIRSAH